MNMRKAAEVQRFFDSISQLARQAGNNDVDIEEQFDTLDLIEGDIKHIRELLESEVK